MSAAIGYFVHHQGRGHAERCAALVNALPPGRPVTIFCARDDIFPDLRAGIEIVRLPSLFEPTGDERPLDWVPAPDTVHCAPLGWPGIRKAMGRIASWFVEADPALMVCDVSAEVAQLARLCSVPHVKVVQHGERHDPGHRAAYDGAAGLLIPGDRRLAQPDWSDAMLAKAHFAPGLGASAPLPDRLAARARIGVADGEEVILVLSGGGGEGVSAAPLAVGARATPDARWITIGRVARDWHATEPGNLRHDGWVDAPMDYLAAADLVVASTGNTTCQQILAAGRPWIAVPEWRYFDEQVHKARALAGAGAALHLPSLPASIPAWRRAIAAVRREHDADLQRSMTSPTAARDAARWLDDLATRLQPIPQPRPIREEPAMTVSALTIARGRAAHLTNVVLGLARQSRLPDELVVGVMQDELYELPDAPFPIRQIRVQTGDELPLAEARNAVAKAATGDVLAFLDVDCIPARGLIADYAAHARPGEGLMMGEVMYLPAGATEGGWRYEGFEAVAVRHSDRQGPPADGRRACDDYRCFWSLNFAMHHDDWAASGGFDEAFVGYGAEDTDFGRTLTDRGIPIWWIRGARVYHQHHSHCMPPIHHLRSILRNAEVFAAKWGHRTMEHWLHAFRMMGLIEDRNGMLHVLREPEPADYALCEQSDDMAYAATAPVLRALEARRRQDEGKGPDPRTAKERHAAMVREQETLLTSSRPLAAE